MGLSLQNTLVGLKVAKGDRLSAADWNRIVETLSRAVAGGGAGVIGSADGIQSRRTFAPRVSVLVGRITVVTPDAQGFNATYDAEAIDDDTVNVETAVPISRVAAVADLDWNPAEVDDPCMLMFLRRREPSEIQETKLIVFETFDLAVCPPPPPPPPLTQSVDPRLLSAHGV